MKSKKIKEIALTGVKGVAIGISMIIPGLSGGTLAVLMKQRDIVIPSAINPMRILIQFSFP